MKIAKIVVVVSYIFMIFMSNLGKIPVLTNIFQMGWNHQLEKRRNISRRKNQRLGVVWLFWGPMFVEGWVGSRGAGKNG